ncbi:MAG: MarR family transcriptional regulator [Nonomuraea sp.]|nr:MarR family transcriptional regulator [Nonomuraea sp.]
MVAAYIVAVEAVSPGYLVWRLSMRWRAAADRALAPLGLTHAQYALLASLFGLSRGGGTPSQRQLATYAGLEPIFVSKLVKTLETAGLLSRSAHPDDTRALALTLTAQGEDLAVRAITTIHALQDELTASIGGADSPRTRALMETLTILLDDGNLPMTDAPPLTGQDINVAAAATRSLLDLHLRRADLTFPQFVAMRRLAQGPATAADLADALRPIPGPHTDVLGELQRLGLAAGFELTPAGRTLLAGLTEATDEVARTIYGDLDPEEMETTRRVLAEVTDRARRLHARL